MKIDVSIIIPLYNRKDLVQHTLNSLTSENQKGVNIEIIVVDDGSIDGGDKLMEEKYPYVRLFRQKNSGAPTARNKGLKEAKGKYILFLDSDDLIEPDFFKAKLSTLDNNKEIAGVYGPFECFSMNPNGEKTIIHRHTAYPLDSVPNYTKHLERLLSGWCIVCHAILWRKDILLQINGYDETLAINQDIDLLFRILIKKNNLIGVKAPLALYRSHDEISRIGNLSTNPKKIIEIYNLRKRFIIDLDKEGLLSNRTKIALGDFCYKYWVSYRKTKSEIAEKFFQLTIELNPKIQVKGGILIQLFGKFAGIRNAIILKSFLKQLIK